MPKQDEMEALARVLECSVADFFFDGTSQTYADGTPLSLYESTLLELFGELDPIDQADVMVYARNLRDRREREARERYGA
ncbi:MAG: hypothetical protein IJ781_06635 [Atopobiaceae bacterium]|nr:hypothetical protein [Atopobiaceae bacterium]